MPTEGYSVPFQRAVLSLMYHDPDFLRGTAEIIKPEFCDEKIDSTFCEMFTVFGKKYPGQKLTKEVIFLWLGKLVDVKRVKKEDLPLFAKTLSEIMAPCDSPGAIKDEIRDFCISKALETEIISSVDLLKKKRYAELVANITKAHDKYSHMAAREETFLTVALPRIMARYKDPDRLYKKAGIRTGIAGVDASLRQGGVSPKELLVLCGPPGRGKSTFLYNFAATAWASGENCLVYTLEVEEEIVTDRIMGCMTGIPMVDLYRYALEVEPRMSSVMRSFDMGELIIRDLPAKRLTPNGIRRDLDYYASIGKRIRALYVDYADLMAADSKIEERRLEHGEIYIQLRAITKEFEVAGFTATQANRDSLRKRDVDLDSLSEDFSKAMTADYVIGLSQDKTEEAARTTEGYGTGKMRMFFAKNRNGKKGHSIPVMTDYTRGRVSIDDWDLFDVTAFGRSSYDSLAMAA